MIDPPPPPPPDPAGLPGPIPTIGRSAETRAAKVQKQIVKKAKVNLDQTSAPTGSGIFDQPVLVVNQRVKLIELNTEYAVYDQTGTQIGAIRQVGQTVFKKIARFLWSLDQFMTHSFQLVDINGAVQLTVTRPAKFFKSKVHVADGTGRRVGSIVQQNMIGKIRFSLEAEGQPIGSLNGENWRAWNFNLQDNAGTEVGRITKTFEGLAKTMFTTADNYVLQIHSPLTEPLRSLVVASAVSVDLALKQDSRGMG